VQKLRGDHLLIIREQQTRVQTSPPIFSRRNEQFSRPTELAQPDINSTVGGSVRVSIVVPTVFRLILFFPRSVRFVFDLG
jgi:hypothetical protein